MPDFIVRIRATVTKDIRVTADDEDEARDEAFSAFTVTCEEGEEEDYSEDILDIQEVQDDSAE